MTSAWTLYSATRNYIRLNVAVLRGYDHMIYTIICRRSNAVCPFERQRIASSSCYLWSAARVRTWAFVIYSLHGRHRHHLKHHTYADDNQIFSSCFPADCASLKIKLIDCIDVVDKRMASNRLMLNPSKSEFLCCCSPRQVLLLDRAAFLLRDGSVDVSSVVRNLGAFFDVTMSLNDHIIRLVRSSYPVASDKVDPPRPAYIDRDSTREFIHHFTSWLL